MRHNVVVQLPGAGREGVESAPDSVPGAAWVWPLAFVIAIVLAFGIGGLSVVDDGGGDGNARRTLVATAADATVKAGSSQVALDIKTDALERNKPTHVQITGAGAFDYSAGEGHIDEHLSGATVPPGTPSDVSLLITRAAVYASGPAVSAGLPVGKTFLKVPVAPPSAVPNPNTTPADTLRILKNVSGPIVKVGKERIRGVDTVHYKTTVDLAKAQAPEPPAGSKASSQQSVPQLSPTGLTLNVATDVWLDKAGRVRRMTMTFDLATMTQTFRGGPLGGPTGSPVTGTQVVTMELFDFGTPARVTAPAADQVVDAPTARGPGFNFGSKTA